MSEFQDLSARYHFARHRYERGVDYRANRRWPRGTLTPDQEHRLSEQMYVRQEVLAERLCRAEDRFNECWDRLSPVPVHPQAFDEATATMMAHAPGFGRSIIGANIKLKLARYEDLYLEPAETELLTDALLARHELTLSEAKDLVAMWRRLGR